MFVTIGNHIMSSNILTWLHGYIKFNNYSFLIKVNIFYIIFFSIMQLQSLKKGIHLVDVEQLLASIRQREKLDVVKWFTALYTKITEVPAGNYSYHIIESQIFVICSLKAH